MATRAVDEVIRRDDDLKNEVVGPMMGADWPTSRLFPNQTVDIDGEVTLGGITLRVEELGPGESSVDSVWWLDRGTVFAGDVAYNGMHAFLADGHWEEWLATLARLDRDLPTDVTLYVGHGPAGGKELLAGQRRYIDTFLEAVTENADAIDDGDHSGVLKAMKSLLPREDLLFLMELSIDPVHHALTTRAR